MKGIVLPQGGFCGQSVTAGLEPPSSAGCCAGHVPQPAQAELCLHSNTGSSGKFLKTTTAITINKNIQRIQKVKLEFTNSHKFSHCHNT